eukprot:409132-Lingulodinium_polyedra.AAC.1
MDSGADDRVCREGFAAEAGLTALPSAKELYDYQENPIELKGVRRVPMLLGEGPEPVTTAAEFTVTAQGGDNALSMGKLLRSGY